MVNVDNRNVQGFHQECLSEADWDRGGGVSTAGDPSPERFYVFTCLIWVLNFGQTPLDPPPFRKPQKTRNIDQMLL